MTAVRPVCVVVLLQPLPGKAMMSLGIGNPPLPHAVGLIAHWQGLWGSGIKGRDASGPKYQRPPNVPVRW